MSGGKPSFLFRILKVVFTSADGSTNTFDGTPQSLVPFKPGLQIEVNLENVLMPAPGGQASIWIHGMTPGQINQLTIAGGMWRIDGKSKVQVFVGDSSSSNLTLIHSGLVIEAKPEFESQPNVAFFISSIPGLMLQMNNTVTPTSFNGSVSAKTALTQVCEKVGVVLSYTGPDVTLSHHYTSGSAYDQIEDIIYAAKLRSFFDGAANTLRVFSQTGSTQGSTVTISPMNGMINYPNFQKNQVSVRTIYDSQIGKDLHPGNLVNIQSSLKAASGTFVIASIRYNLSCNNPMGGPWELIVSAYPATAGASGDSS